MALKDILTNGTYADDIVLALPDGTTATVGEMRQMAAQERAALVQRSQNLDLAEQAVLTRVNKLKGAGLLDDNMEPITSREVKEHITATTGMTEDDPLFGPLVKETKAQIAAMRTEVEGYKTQLQQVANATRQGIQGYLSDHYSATFSREQAALPESIRPKVTLEAAVKYATDRKLMDDVGRLDITAAVDRLTWDARKAVELEAVNKQKEEIAEGRKALSSMQRPGTGNAPRAVDTGFKPTDDKGHTKSLDEAIAAAADDDTIWNSALQYVQ